MPIKFIILGSGSSMGVPSIDGYFGNCDPKNNKNYRTRCSALIKFNKENYLIDTSPDLRQQLLSVKVKSIDKVFYTHLHADQTHGINDLRPFYLKQKKRIPVYADKKTSKYLYSTFQYCFKSSKSYPSTLSLNKLKKKHLFKNKKKKISIQPITVMHGKINSICYLINNKLAYAGDVSKFYEKDLKLLKKLKYFVIDCLWYKKHPAHFNLDNVLKIIKTIKPQKTILINMHNDIDYNEIKEKLPRSVEPGYDGMTLAL